MTPADIACRFFGSASATMARPASKAPDPANKMPPAVAMALLKVEESAMGDAKEMKKK